MSRENYFESFFLNKRLFNLLDFDFEQSSLRGQSAIEYLMTYGWMLLVVAVVGGAVFSIVQSESIDSVSGFTGSDILVDNTGLTSDDNLDMVLRNGAADQVDINKITVTDGEREAYFLSRQSIDVGDQEAVTVNGIIDGDGSNSLDIIINYDSSGLSNLETSGTISGSLDLKAGKPVDSAAPQTGGDWTWVDGSNYFGTDYGNEEGFYVMKYEAREDAGNAVSQPEGEPWRDIAFNNAYDECRALSNSNYDVSMITNTEWMTIARQVESQGQNWVDGDIGSSRDSDKGIVRGWSAGDRNADWENDDVAPDSTRANLYNSGKDEGSSTGNDLFRRTHVLGSGGIIWDFVGNAHDFVDVEEEGTATALTDANISSDASAGFIESSVSYNSRWAFNEVGNIEGVDNEERYEIGSANDNYGLDQNLGAYFDSGESNQIARRGGVYSDYYRAGPYAIRTNLGINEGQSATGFRCAAVPT